MWHPVRNLSREQRLSLESLLGRGLRDDEGVNIQPSYILQKAPVGEARSRAYGDYLASLDRLNARTADTADDVLEAAIDEACKMARQPVS
jgi:hypothetical protein